MDYLLCIGESGERMASEGTTKKQRETPTET